MANKRARARPCHAAGDLADDVLRDVFARLPGFQDLLRSAATCKRWRRLITDRDFLRRIGLWPETARRPSVLVGIFSQDAHPAGPSSFMPRKPGSAPQFLSLQLQAGGDGRLAFDSLVADEDGLFDFARPLASRRGLLLVRIIRPTRVGNGIDRQPLHLAVCRPLIDKRSTRVLPPPLLDSMAFFAGDLTGCALLTDADYGDAGGPDNRRQPNFQVLLICANRDRVVCACTYSSATGSWSGPIKCPQDSAMRWRCGARAGVVTGDTAHWLYMDNTDFYTLSINATTSHVSMAKIPVSRFGPSMPLSHRPLLCIAAGEGRLSFVTIQYRGVLELWTKQEQNDEDEAGWQRSRLTDLGSKKRIGSVFFAESRGALLINQDGTFVAIDLKSKEKMLVDLKDEKLRHLGNRCRLMFEGRCTSTGCTGWHEYDRTCPSRPPVLYEIDWVLSGRVFVASSQLGDEIGTD